MFRLPGNFFFLVAAAATLLTGCHHVMYRDVYSPRRNHFVAPQEKAPELPEDKKKAGGAPLMDPSAPPSALPPAGAPMATPAIPGLEPVPAMPMAP